MCEQQHSGRTCSLQRSSPQEQEDDDAERRGEVKPQRDEQEQYEGQQQQQSNANANANASSSGSTFLSRNQANLWKEMCRSFLDRKEMKSSIMAYLRVACEFLYAITSFHLENKTSSSSSLSMDIKINMEMKNMNRNNRSSNFHNSNDNTKSDNNSSSKKNDDDEVGEDWCSRFSFILSNQNIAFTDRIGFATLYLPPKNLKAYLEQESDTMIYKGNLEGLILTGMGNLGSTLLQSYLDRTGDLQTVSLLSSRLCYPLNLEIEKEVGDRWISEYRELLNGAQLWHDRALFDVARAEVQQEKLAIMRLAVQKCSSSSSSSPSSSSSAATEVNELISRIPPPRTVPPEVHVRCNYCNTAIQLNSLRKQGQGNNTRVGQSWLSMQKSILPCCPECRKPLPRCYICLLPLGCLNPYLELRRQVRLQTTQQAQAQAQISLTSDKNQSQNSHSNFSSLLQKYHSPNRFLQQGGGSSGGGGGYSYAGRERREGGLGYYNNYNGYSGGVGSGPYSSSSHTYSNTTTKTSNNINPHNQKVLDYDSMNFLGGIKFSEWFTWCNSCKHGGHSHHIHDWFEVYEECGVNGCSCKCKAMDKMLL